MTRRRARAGTAAARPEGFFERFRAAIGRLPVGLIRVPPPADPADIARAEAALGRALPAAYASFLRSFDGADLFHETLLLAGVGPQAALPLGRVRQDHPGELIFAEAASGDRFGLDDRGRVVRHDEGAEERGISGSSFPRWLDATVAREQILFGPDGEYAPDLYDAAGEELLPVVALRQSERALKADPDAPEAEHARGLALARLDRREAALQAFARAAALDDENPWPLFDLGRTALALDRADDALAAFRRAAALEPGPTGARLLAWAARAAMAGGDRPAAAVLRGEALARDPELAQGLERAVREAIEQDDPEAGREATALLEAITPGAPGTLGARRLPIVSVSAPASRPPPPAPPRRPGPAAPRRSGGSRRGSRR